jgi:uncharacterized membrane protein YdjX (TVP38/TMEM64 family)
MTTVRKRSASIIKALLFVVFIITAILVFQFTPLKEYLHPQSIKNYLAATGSLAPLLFILAYAIGI